MNKTESRTKRLADLVAGDVILIDRGGHRAVVQRNTPHVDPGLRARGFYQTAFLMDDGGDGRDGGWSCHADSMVRVAATTIGGAR
jgi:hypothetical protein